MRPATRPAHKSNKAVRMNGCLAKMRIAPRTGRDRTATPRRRCDLDWRSCTACHRTFGVIGYFRERERWKSRGFITKTIPEGMATPKKRGGAMPPLGGAPSSAVDLQAVSAYVWAIAHSAAHWSCDAQ
jgi:hypothetical protein